MQAKTEKIEKEGKKNKMASYKTKRTLKQILAVALAGLAAFGAIFGLVKLSEVLKEETKVIHPTFSVGGLNADGEYEKTDGSIYTKESFGCDGLTVQLDFDSAVSYQVFFYDELDKYLSSSIIYTENMEIEVPEGAEYARLEVTPIWEDDVNEKDRKVHWYNVASYADQLEISVFKDQEATWVSEWANVSLTEDERFIHIEGVYFSRDGTQSASPEYDSYVFTATEKCKVYVESDLSVFQYVAWSNGTGTRYQKSDGTYVGGVAYALELSKGDKIMISFHNVNDPSDVTFCEERSIRK